MVTRYKYEEQIVAKHSLLHTLNMRGDNGWQVVNIHDSGKSINGWKALDIIFMKEELEASVSGKEGV